MVKTIYLSIHSILDESEESTLHEAKQTLASLQVSLQTEVDTCIRHNHDLKLLHEALQYNSDKNNKKLCFIATRKCIEKLLQVELYLDENFVKLQPSALEKSLRDIEQFLSKLSGLWTLVQSSKEVTYQADTEIEQYLYRLSKLVTNVFSEDGSSVHNAGDETHLKTQEKTTNKYEVLVKENAKLRSDLTAALSRTMQEKSREDILETSKENERVLTQLYDEVIDELIEKEEELRKLTQAFKLARKQDQIVHLRNHKRVMKNRIGYLEEIVKILEHCSTSTDESTHRSETEKVGKLIEEEVKLKVESSLILERLASDEKVFYSNVSTMTDLSSMSTSDEEVNEDDQSPNGYELSQTMLNNDSFEKQVSVLHHEVADKDEELTRVREEVKVYETEIRDLKQHATDAETALQEAVYQLHEREEELTSAHTRQESLTELVKQLETSKQVVADKDEELTRVREEVKVYETEIRDLKQQAADAETALQEAVYQLHEREEELTSANTRQESLTELVKQLETRKQVYFDIYEREEELTSAHTRQESPTELVKQLETSKQVEDLSLRCEIHKDDKKDMFCSVHNQPCCAKCVFLYHRRCPNVTIISESVNPQSTMSVQGYPYKVLIVQEKYMHDVRIKRDSKECCIIAICVLSDGQVLLADRNNKKVKLLNQQYQVVNHCGVTGYLHDMCQITPSEVAVAVNSDKKHEIKFITVKESQLVASRKLKFQHDCRGIAYHQGDLYVTSYTALYKYSLIGEMISKLFEDTSEFQTVFKCAVSLSGDKLYITCFHQSKLLILAREGTVLATYTDPEMLHPGGVCVTPGGQVLVCGYKSCTIIQVDVERMKKLSTLATRSDWTEVPMSVCYSSTTSCIIAGQAWNNILVLKVEQVESTHM